MPRAYEDYLADILTAIQAIEANVSGITFQGFVADSNRVKAVLLDLAIIGEACHHIPDEERDRAPEVEWGQIVGLRNVIIHGYWLLNYRAIWEAAHNDVPRLRVQLSPLLDKQDDAEA